MPPGWDVFPEPVPDGSFPERSVGHGKTGLLRVGGTADFGMPRRSTERPETGRKLPHCQLGHAGVELRRGNGGSLNRTVSAAIGGNIAPWRTIGGVGGQGGIRTHDTLLTYTHFPGARLRPLGHLSDDGADSRARKAGQAPGPRIHAADLS